MNKLWRLLALLFAFSLVAAACGGGDDDESADGDSGSTDSGQSADDNADSDGDSDGDDEGATLVQGADLTFHMITHSDDGPFWSVVKRGMDAACEDLGVECVWMPG